MPHVLIIHEGADYKAWKKVFDGATARAFCESPRLVQIRQETGSKLRNSSISLNWNSAYDEGRHCSAIRAIGVIRS